MVVNLQFTGSESNYCVLKRVLEYLLEGDRDGQDFDGGHLASAIQKFLAHKEHIATELDELTIRARGGDKQAARDLILKLAEMNDGA